ncbi:DsrE family protein [Candidatus Chloroploca sp. Khr17]|uniref:DsrE family protein n=1 Tax=Candidatus Chloroploca sp. Khr17 TaxID=2496869 RepID=UPI00101DEFC4|nr:DsrE family protein [Candidatus Chloroploca sp. Khr17]
MPDMTTVILINRAGMGETDPALQQKLLATYLRLLNENNSLPAAICVYTEGVKLVVHGSPVLAELQALEARGVHVISCLTCLDYYGLTEQLAVGVIGGMPDIIAAQWGAQKVITL